MKSLFFILALLTPLTTCAASFDCNTAKAADEKAICSNLTLNDKDVEMATTYRLLRGLFAMGVRGDMMDAQARWLNTRQQCGGDVACLNRAYDNRLQQLNAIYNAINKPL